MGCHWNTDYIYTQYRQYRYTDNIYYIYIYVQYNGDYGNTMYLSTIYKYIYVYGNNNGNANGNVFI